MCERFGWVWHQSDNALQAVLLVWAQRELAMYVYHNLDRPLTTYFLDKDISPVFKGADLQFAPLSLSLMSHFDQQLRSTAGASLAACSSLSIVQNYMPASSRS